MPEFSFKGFATGSAVAISASQGDTDAANSIANWRGNLASLSISVSAPSMAIAPAQVWLEAFPSGFSTTNRGATYDPKFHEVEYFWTVDGEPFPEFTAPENIVTGWNNANKAKGKLVCMCLPDPGNYTITCVARNTAGEIATKTTSTITVQDPDTVFSGTNTIAVALDADFSGKPAGATEVTSISALMAEASSRLSPFRVAFKRGEDYGPVHFFVSGEYYAYFDAWGSGGRPVLHQDPTASRDPVIQYWTDNILDHVQVRGIEFQGGWDSTIELGYSPTSGFAFNQSEIPDAFWTIHDCVWSGFDIGVWATVKGGNIAGNRFLASNTTITNWQNYGVFCQDMNDGYLALVGCRLTQDVDALEGGPKSKPHNNHGPVRIATSEHVYLAQNDLFSRNGWSGDPDNQPCLRLNTNTNLGVKYNVWRNTSEGGFIVVSMQGQNSAEDDNPGNYVLDSNLFIGTARTHTDMIKADFGGTTFRNNIGVMPAGPLITGGGSGDRSFFEFDPNNSQNDNLNEPVSIYNNTLLHMKVAPDADGRVWNLAESVGGLSNDFTLENNIIHAPAIANAVTADAPIDTATAIPGVTPRYKGKRNGFDTTEFTLSTPLANGAFVDIPYSAFSQALTDGTNSSLSTDQAYWQSRDAEDTRHYASPSDGARYYAAFGDFTLAFNANDIRLTNNSGVSWPAGTLDIKPDRSSLIPALDASYASPTMVPLPQPQTGSAAIAGGDAGTKAVDDFWGELRPTVGNARGALSF